jgi:hypothetical protein
MVAKASTILRKRGAYWTPATILVTGTSALDPKPLFYFYFNTFLSTPHRLIAQRIIFNSILNAIRTQRLKSHM